MSEKNDSHWWEFYGVRYAQGTVVGAVMVFFLFSQNEVLKKLLFIPSDPKDFGMPHLILLAVYGLAYCYISSAPILILHAGRGLLFKSKINANPNGGAIRRLLWVFIPSVMLAIIYYLNSKVNEIIGSLAIFVFSMVFMFQVVVLCSIFFVSWDEVMDYYLVIAEKRERYKDSGYVESYKHIREHGNSFLIVVFQFFLAFPIYTLVLLPNIASSDSIRNFSLIILFWIFPAAFVWFLGNRVENNLQSM